MTATTASERDPERGRDSSGLRPTLDAAFCWTCRAAAFVVPVLTVALAAILVRESAPFFSAHGLRFLIEIPWNPGGATPAFGGLALIYGTLVTSAIAMVLAVPIGVGSSVYLAVWAPRWLRSCAGALVELLAAIPSVVYGLWGLIIFAPWIGGPGILAAGVILAVMIVPYVTAISTAACRSAPQSQCDAALALGATRWQLARTVILPHARPGIIAAGFLALGRALGETMAVTMLIGNMALAIESPIHGVGDSIASVIASQLNEATTEMQRSGLVALALSLFTITLLVNALGRWLILRVGRQPRRRARATPIVGVHPGRGGFIPPRSHSTAVNRLMAGLLLFALVAALTPLFLILGFIVIRGVPGLTLEFFTRLPAPPGTPGGGLAHALVGSARLVSLAAAAAVPIGLLGAIALAEFTGSRLAAVIRFIDELLAGVPSIIIGIFGYSVVVCAFDPPRFSAWAGSFALGVMMLPIVLRTAEEALRAVPDGLRHASFALGSGQFHTVARVVLPAAAPGIATGIVLALARIAGETAPLLLTAYGSSFFARSFSDPTPFLPKYIYSYATSGFPEQEQQAWTAALVLLAFIVAITSAIRIVTNRRTERAERST